jgi:hypothetical protein
LKTIFDSFQSNIRGREKFNSSYKSIFKILEYRSVTVNSVINNSFKDEKTGKQRKRFNKNIKLQPEPARRYNFGLNYTTSP